MQLQEVLWEALQEHKFSLQNFQQTLQQHKYRLKYLQRALPNCELKNLQKRDERYIEELFSKAYVVLLINNGQKILGSGLWEK